MPGSTPHSSAEALSPLAGPTIKAALFLAFGVTLGLWLVAGYGLTRRMADVESRAAEINIRYMRAQELLSNVRAQVLVGSVLVRDALLDPEAAAAAGYRQRFETSYREADEALRQYVPVLDTPAEQSGVASLRREVDDFHRSMLAVLSTGTGQGTRQSRQILLERVMPRREAAIGISEQVQALNRSAFVAQNLATADVYEDAQRHAWQQLGFAVGASLAIGLIAAFYSAGLEGRLRRQRARDLQLTTELHRLSGQIVNAQEDERRMIARELHDEVGQALAAIRVELAFAQRAGESPATIASRLDDVRSITEGALHTIRDISHLLHPAMLDDLGLAAALEPLVQAFERRHGVQVTVQHEGRAQRMAPALELTVYRIVQEALTNIAKHARARHCRINVRHFPDAVRVRIEDDGIGFDEAAAPVPAASGLGLIGIRERAAQFGGTMHVDSAPGRGTTLSVELPTQWQTLPARTMTPHTTFEEDSTRGSLANLPR